MTGERVGLKRWDRKKEGEGSPIRVTSKRAYEEGKEKSPPEVGDKVKRHE